MSVSLVADSLRGHKSIQLIKGGDQPIWLESLTINSIISWDLGSIATRDLWNCDITSYEDSFQRLFDMAMSCRQNAENLALVPMFDPDENTPPVTHLEDAAPPFTFPRVTFLQLGDNIPLSFQSLMSFPEVRQIHLLCSDTEYPWTGGERLRALTRCPTWPKLRVLSLQGYLVPEPDDLRPILVANPSITELSALHCRDIARLVLLLVLPLQTNQAVNTQATILPNLSLLRIAGCAPNVLGSFGMALRGLLKARPNLQVITDKISWDASFIPWEDLKLNKDKSMAERLTVENYVPFQLDRSRIMVV